MLTSFTFSKPTGNYILSYTFKNKAFSTVSILTIKISKNLNVNRKTFPGLVVVNRMLLFLYPL